MFKKSNKIRKLSGFTLVEIIVSIFIISILSGGFLANYHATSNNTKILMAAQKLASDIRMAQSYSLGVKDNNGITPKWGWGIYFANNADNYIIFANDDEGVYLRDAGGGEDVNVVDMPAGVRISSVETNIVFLPPDPSTFIDVGGNPESAADITLTDGAATKTVRVNFFGLVEVLN